MTTLTGCGRRHALATMPPERKSLPIEQEAGYVPDSVCACLRTNDPLSHTESNADLPAHSLVATSTTLSRTPNVYTLFILLWHCSPTRSMASSFSMRFLDHTQRRTTVGRSPLDEWSARRRDLYLTTHNTHNRHLSMPPAGFEPTIPAGERPQTYASDHAATGTGECLYTIYINFSHQIAVGNSNSVVFLNQKAKTK